MFDHIESNPDILGGKPCIKGSRISVEHILELVASGATREQIVQTYPHITVAEIEEALRYAARFLRNEIVTEVRLAS